MPAQSFEELGRQLFGGECPQNGDGWQVSQPRYWQEGNATKPSPDVTQRRGRSMAAITVGRPSDDCHTIEVQFTYYVDGWALRDVTITQVSRWGDIQVSFHDQEGTCIGPVVNDIVHPPILPAAKAQEILSQVSNLFREGFYPQSLMGEVF